MTRFYAALLGGHLLPARLLDAMKRPVPGSHYLGATRPSYGLGLAEMTTSCGRVYGHEAIATGYRTIAYARPDGSRVALVMINIDETRVPQSELELAADTAFCSR